jgi:hypothetical protein
MNTSYSTEILTHQQAEVIQELVNCALACEACAALCLKEPEVRHMVRCAELARDCADTCLQASRLVVRKSEIADNYLTICDEICRLCADECRLHDADHCEICAAACDSCAETCQRYYNSRD